MVIIVICELADDSTMKSAEEEKKSTRTTFAKL